MTESHQPRRSGFVLFFVAGWSISMVVVGGVAFLAVTGTLRQPGAASGVAAAEAVLGDSVALAPGAGLAALALAQSPVWALQLATVATAVWARGRSWRWDLGLRFRLIDLPVGLVAGVGAQFGIGLLYRLLEPWLDVNVEKAAEQLIARGQGAAALVIMLLLWAVAAPVVEELLFRGLLQGGLARLLPGPAAVALTALIFAAGHFQLVQLPGLLVAGLVFGGLAHFHGRLGPAIVAHAFFNATTVVALARL
ncbi:MAG: lysostaphin resistance A-like protein [Acidimicrobiales bacterium]